MEGFEDMLKVSEKKIEDQGLVEELPYLDKDKVNDDEDNTMGDKKEKVENDLPVQGPVKETKEEDVSLF